MSIKLRIEMAIPAMAIEEAIAKYPLLLRSASDRYHSLLDIQQFPAELLVREYHQRWEVENTIDELKTVK